MNWQGIACVRHSGRLLSFVSFPGGSVMDEVKNEVGWPKVSSSLVIGHQSQAYQVNVPSL